MQSHNNHRNYTVCFILLILISIFIRLGIAYLWKDSFFERGNRYNLVNPVALNIIHHKEFGISPNNPTTENEPLYPFFVALSYFLFGVNWFGIAFMQSTINILNAILIFYITMRVFNNEKISLVAFMLFLFYPFYIFQSISVSDTVVFCFLLALSTLLTIKCNQIDNVWIFLITGFIWGLALLTRFSAISLFPFVFIYFFINFPFKKAIQTGVIILFACIVTLFPWIYRNYKLTGSLLITTHGGIELWLGYNKDTYRVISNNITVDSMKKNLDRKLPELEKLKEKGYPLPTVREVEASKIFLKYAVDFALNNPLECLKMLPVKFWKFWSWNYNPDYNSGKPFRDSMRSVVYTLSYLPILILALSGIVLTKHSWRTHSIFLLLFLGYSLLHTTVYGFTRLRIPLDQFLIIYAAYAIIFYLKKIKEIYCFDKIKG